MEVDPYRAPPTAAAEAICTAASATDCLTRVSTDGSSGPEPDRSTDTVPAEEEEESTIAWRRNLSCRGQDTGRKGTSQLTESGRQRSTENRQALVSRLRRVSVELVQVPPTDIGKCMSLQMQQALLRQPGRAFT
jgi:hypothetical protein